MAAPSIQGGVSDCHCPANSEWRERGVAERRSRSSEAYSTAGVICCGSMEKRGPDLGVANGAGHENGDGCYGEIGG